MLEILNNMIHKGKAALYMTAAASAGMSLNEWIETTLDKAANINE